MEPTTPPRTPRRQAPSHSRQRILLAACALVLVVVGGSSGFMLIEGWPFWRAFFFTLISVTTVGYGAEGLSETGERFTAILLIGGIGTATYAFGVIVQAFVAAQLSWRQNMQRQIQHLSQHYIICGYGRIGRTVTDRLDEARIPFVVIEGDHDSLELARERGFLAIRGNATEDEVLLGAGIERARGIVAAVNSDSDNIVITLGARELRPDISVIARVDEEGATRKIRRAGADIVVSPFRTGAVDIANAIIQPNVTEFLRNSTNGHGEGGFELSEVTVSTESELAGATVGDLRSGDDTVVIVAIRSSHGATNLGPKDDDCLGAGDVVIVAGDPLIVASVCSRLGGGGGGHTAPRALTTWGPAPPS